MFIDILITLSLVFLNGYFVAAEFALVKIRGSQLEFEAGQGNKSAKLGLVILSNLEAYLSACQLGITIVSLALGAVGEPLVEHMLEGAFHSLNLEVSPSVIKTVSYLISFSSLIILTTLHVVFGEQVPKIMALQKAKKTTLLTVYPLYFFYKIFKPGVWLLNWLSNKTLALFGFHAGSHGDNHTAEELELLIDQGKETGAIVKQEHEIFKNVFGFNKIKVHQIMVDHQQVTMIDIEDPIENVLSKVINEQFSRIPVYKGDRDNVVGILYTKDLIRLMNNKKDGETISIKDAMKEPHLVHPGKRISELLKELQAKRMHMAIIVDEYGSVSGLVTIEDILEEIVGEIEDEHDEVSPIVKKIGDGEFLVNALGTITDVNEHLPVSLPKGKYSTVSGYLINHQDRIPNLNDVIKTDDYTITVVKKENNAVKTVKIKKN